MRTVMIIGEPASGKTTLMRDLIPFLGSPKKTKFKEGETISSVYPEVKTVLLGIYDGSLYDGTDRLALHTQPQAIKLAQRLARRKGEWVLLLEGDRYATPSFLTAVRALGPVIVVALDVPWHVLEARHARRGDHQNAQWLNGRTTKFRNLWREAASHDELLYFTHEDMDGALSTLRTCLKEAARVGVKSSQVG